MRGWVLALGVVALAGAAGAQPRGPGVILAPRPAGAAAAVDASGIMQSRVTALGKRVRGLEGRVSTLEELLRKTQAATSFTCVDPITSANGAGAREDCTPYACNYMDGRCRTSAVSSDRCAPGFLWVSGNQCVPAPNGD